MTPPEHVSIGPLTKIILDGAKLLNEDRFPGRQVWANEIEHILAFLKAEGQFKRFLPRLRATERDGALAEARVGFYFHRLGFSILGWEPEAVSGIPGDLEISWQGSEPLFLEVKCPRWEGELEENERRAGRKERGKYLNTEVRSVGPVERVVYVIGKALPKFDVANVNLVVVVDDLFLSPLEIPKNVVSEQLSATMAEKECYSTISGVLMLNPVVSDGEVEYRSLFVLGPGKPLPDVAKEVLVRH